jgi:gluconokinase
MTGAQQAPLVVMGVQGSGKSTIGAALAAARGLRFVDGDALHSDEAREQMRTGHPLTDADRRPWLARVARTIADAQAQGEALVVACSALRRPYRDAMRALVPTLRFVHLDGPRAVIAERLARRSHAYMPVSLLDSQFATLEPLDPDENGVRVDIAASPDEIVAQVNILLGAAS